MILLLIAEAPLVCFTCAIALQNEQFRTQDTLSRIGADQRTALDQLTHGLQAARTLATALGTLPRNLRDDPPTCAAVLNLLVAADTNRVRTVSLEGPADHVVCTSGGDPDPPSPLPPRGTPTFAGLADHLSADRSGITFLHPLETRDGDKRAVLIKLASPSVPSGPQHADAASPCLWLAQSTGLQPLDCADPQAAPASGWSGSAPLAPHRQASLDGRAFLYSSVRLPDGYGTAGATLWAGSDIRAASIASARWFAFRAAEIAGLFGAELALIAAGVSVVVSAPLKRLNDAVTRWRAGGGFDIDHARYDPGEVHDLAASFIEATKSLNIRERELRGAMRQQDALMKEIHHRVKNNLQIIASLLNLQATRIKAPEARAEFQSARDRVRALGTLHRHLYADGELHSINMRGFFGELCSHMFQAAGETEGDRITLTIDAPEVRLSSDQAVPIALIVTETVGNAIKFAFPDQRRGHISVRMEVGAQQQAALTIGDDGVGMPQRQDQAAGGSAGLGLQLVRGFAKQLGGRLTVSTDAGTCYRLDMTLQLHRPPEALADAPPGSPA